MEGAGLARERRPSRNSHGHRGQGEPNFAGIPYAYRPGDP